MKDYFEKPKVKRIKKRKVVIVSIILLISIFLITIVVLYNNNMQVRRWIDIHILRKEIMQNDVKKIDILDGQKSSVYAYSRYVAILNKNKLNIYNSAGANQQTLDVEIQNPIFHSTNRFLSIAEKNGGSIYVIEDDKILWKNTVEGNISQIQINENGYVGVVIKGTTYESIIVVYDFKGKELFKTYLSSSNTVDISISKDNKFLAVAEVDTSGTIVQSQIKVISIETAMENPTEAIQKTYKSEADKLIINLEYNNRNKLVVMYNNSISVIEEEKENIIVDDTDKNISFKSIDLNNSIVYVNEKSSGLFTADSYINIIELDTKKDNEYIVNSVIKELYSKGNIIAVNLGTQIEFINKDAGLVKRYIADQEITKITVSENIGAIMYNDRIEIINL